MAEFASIAGLAQGLHPAVRAVVLEALTRGVGEPLSTNVEYKTRFNVGAGTMQRALDLLRDRGALTVVNRGHLGRRIERLDISQAWQAAGLASVRLLLPLGGPIEIDVLADVLANELTHVGVPHTVHHLRGGAGRLVSVRAGHHDLAVVSTGSWSGARVISTLHDTEVVRKLAPGTYYAPQRLVVVTRERMTFPDIRRVAIDRQSSDHVELTQAEFPESEGFEYVDAPFPSVPAWVLRGRVDAGIWHRTTSVIPLDLAGIDLAELQRPASKKAWNTLSGAALIGTKKRPELASVMAALRLDRLWDDQHAALTAETDDSLDGLG